MAQGNGSETLVFDINLMAPQGSADYCGILLNNVRKLYFLTVKNIVILKFSSLYLGNQDSDSSHYSLHKIVPTSLLLTVTIT